MSSGTDREIYMDQLFDIAHFKSNIYTQRIKLLNQKKNYLKIKKRVDNFTPIVLLYFPVGILAIGILSALDILQIPLEPHYYVGIIMLPIFIHMQLAEYYNDHEEVYRHKEQRLEKAEKDFENIIYLLQHRKDFILYLRDFNSGRGFRQKFTRSFVPYGAINGKDTTKEIVKYFVSKHPVVLLNSDSESTEFSEGYLIYPTNDQWFHVFIKLLKYCKYVVLDYSANILTENIKKEIDTIIQTNMKNIILIADEHIQQMLYKYNLQLKEQILCTCKIFKRDEYNQIKDCIDFASFEQTCK